MRTSIVVIGLSIALPVLLSRRLQLPAAWDRDGDGTVTPSEALASALGNTLGRASWAAAAAYRAASATILLLVAGGLWLMARSFVNAIASRFVVTFEARSLPPRANAAAAHTLSNPPRLPAQLEEPELCAALARAVELGQLDRSRHLRLGRAVH